jgi:hypothetical protein
MKIPSNKNKKVSCKSHILKKQKGIVPYFDSEKSIYTIFTEGFYPSPQKN